MLKKTTIYIEENELNGLKTLSVVRNKSITELVRLGVKQICKSAGQEEIKAIEMLNKIRKNTRKKGYSSKEIMQLAVKAQRKARNERKKKKNRRS